MNNMYKTTTTLLVALAGLFIINACEKDVILDLADTEGAYVIVEAHITNDGRRQWVKLSHSSSYYDRGFGDPVSGAEVKIETHDEVFTFSESLYDSLAGFYYHDEISEILHDSVLYTLNITKKDQVFTAESLLKPVPQLDSVTLKINPFSEQGINTDTVYDIMAHFHDLPTEDNFYLFNYYVNDTLRTERPGQKGLVSDINLEEYVSFAVLSINQNRIKDGDRITLEISSISGEMFEFYDVFFFQTNLSGNPFAGAPPANIPTNLSEGARGFFQVSALNRKHVVYETIPF